MRSKSRYEKFSQYVSMIFNWYLKAVDHVKSEGQVATYLKIVFTVFSVSLEAVLLHTKRSRALTLQIYGIFLWKFAPEVEKHILWYSSKVLPNQVSKKVPLYVWIYWLKWVICKVTKKQCKTLGANSIWRSEVSNHTVFLRALTDFCCILHKISSTEIESISLLNFRTSPFRKLFTKNYLW